MNSLKFVALMMFVGFEAVAQQPCGIYAKKEDFLASKVRYAFEGCEMRVQNNKDIVGMHKNHELRFKFDFIYGYSDGKNTYRAYGAQSPWKDHGFYKIIYEGDVVVYERITWDYRSNLQVFYYYSTTKDSPIMLLKKRFYSYPKDQEGILQLNTARLKEHIGLPVSNNELAIALIEVDESILQIKKKPGISTRLQTTTRRPVFSNRSLWRKQERTLLSL